MLHESDSKCFVHGSLVLKVVLDFALGNTRSIRLYRSGATRTGCSASSLKTSILAWVNLPESISDPTGVT